MEIIVDQLGKKFEYEWIFRQLSFHFHTQNDNKYAIVGANGSGKSTFMQILSGYMLSTEGTIQYKHQDQNIAPEKIYTQINFVAPYTELIEELSPLELLHIHQQFKPLKLTPKALLEILYLDNAQQKPIRFFSSGMKQRLKLGLAFFSQGTLLFLDEPTSNLDQKGIQWYNDQLQQLSPETLIIIASNDKREYELCQETIPIEQFKNRK
ncbi:MAG: ATP-binding cassette domain-containing protein [Cytophagales bacterium]|nr:MAG: ATP-binding cassette domain-containing protein [Cytophagales bacterium]